MRHSPKRSMKHSIPAAFTLVMLLLLPAHADERTAAAAKLVEARAPSIVTVKFLLKTEMSTPMGARDHEAKVEASGVVVGSNGLVMLANQTVDPQIPRGMRRMMGAQVELKSSARGFKVLLGSDPKEHAATLVARDSSLGVAFVQVIKASGLPAIDFSSAVEPKLGDRLWGVTRMGRVFDYAPGLTRAMVSARVEKPRGMWAVNGGTLGLPLFNREGVPVGIVSVPKIEDDDDGGGGGGGGMMAAMTGGGGGADTFILPVKSIQRAIDSAAKRGAKAIEKAAEEKEEEEEEEAKEERKPDDG